MRPRQVPNRQSAQVLHQTVFEEEKQIISVVADAQRIQAQKSKENDTRQKEFARPISIPVVFKIERHASLSMHRDHMYTDQIIYEAKKIENPFDEDTFDFVVEESAPRFKTKYLRYIAKKCKKAIDKVVQYNHNEEKLMFAHPVEKRTFQN